MGMADQKTHWFQGENGRSATQNVGPVLLDKDILFLDTSEHIPQDQPNITPTSNFPLEAEILPLSASTDVYTVDQGNKRGNAYLVKKRSKNLASAQTNTQLLRAVHQNGD